MPRHTRCNFNNFRAHAPVGPLLFVTENVVPCQTGPEGMLRQGALLSSNGRISVPMNHCDLQTIVGPMNVSTFQAISALPVLQLFEPR